MAENQNEVTLLNSIYLLVTIVLGISGGLTTLFHFFVKRGKNLQKYENRIKLIESGIIDLNKRIDQLETEKEQLQRESNEIHEQIRKGLSQLDSKISYIQGKVDQLTSRRNGQR